MRWALIEAAIRDWDGEPKRATRIFGVSVSCLVRWTRNPYGGSTLVDRLLLEPTMDWDAPVNSGQHECGYCD